MGKQAASQTQSLWSKYTAASLCDPLPASMGGGAQSQLDALVAKNFADGDIICLALSAGGSVHAALKCKKRLARCEEKKLWHSLHGSGPVSVAGDNVQQ